jgi:hypothetical protein
LNIEDTLMDKASKMTGIKEETALVELDGLVKSRKSTRNVIPAKAGIQKYQMVTKVLDPDFRRSDDFLRVHQAWA